MLKEKEHVFFHEQSMVYCLPSSRSLRLSRQAGSPYFHQQIINADQMDTEIKTCIYHFNTPCPSPLKPQK